MGTMGSNTAPRARSEVSRGKREEQRQHRKPHMCACLYVLARLGSGRECGAQPVVRSTDLAPSHGLAWGLRLDASRMSCGLVVRTDVQL